MNLYVSNLAYSVTDDELRSEFAAFGQVSSVQVVMDRETGRSRGFGFVDMPDGAEAKAAMTGLEGSNLAGRAMKIVEARPKEERPRPQVGGGGYPDGHKKKSDRGHAGGFRSSPEPTYNDWDDRNRAGKKPKPRERGRHQSENDWD
jgi:RNA recognition motif-containing protein